MLDAKGRCCGRKPILYTSNKYTNQPQRFCPRCDRSYEIETDEQIENFHWKKVGLKFVHRNEVPIKTVLDFQGEQHELTKD